MFEIKLNDNIHSFLRALQGEDIILKDELTSYLDKDSIPMSSLMELYKENKKIPQCKEIKTLLSPLEFKFREKYVPGSNYTPEFRKQLAMLKYKAEENEYQIMIKKKDKFQSVLDYDSIDKRDEDNLTPAQINKQIKEQITTVFNILVSVISVVFAIWYWSGSSSFLSVELRILLCLFFGVLVLVAEVVVYNGYLQRIDDAKVKERSKREYKKVVKTINLSGDKNKISNTSSKKIENKKRTKRS